MQLSRIKNMSEKRKKAWIEAIDELVEDYKSDQQDYLDCPLCRVSAECDGCLWPIIEGCDCGQYEWGNGYVGVPQRWEGNYGTWRAHRLTMLGRWRMIITFSSTDSLNRFRARVEEIRKTFAIIGKELREKLLPLGEAIKKVNEAVEKMKKEKKKGGNQ